jgi:hypothetical protein
MIFVRRVFGGRLKTVVVAPFLNVQFTLFFNILLISSQYSPCVTHCILVIAFSSSASALSFSLELVFSLVILISLTFPHFTYRNDHAIFTGRSPTYFDDPTCWGDPDEAVPQFHIQQTGALLHNTTELGEASPDRASPRCVALQHEHRSSERHRLQL